MSVIRPIGVVVADDHPLMLTGVIARLSVEDDITVVGRATTCQELLRAVRAQMPDVVVADVTMTDGSVLDVLGDLARAAPSARILLLSATDDPAAVSTALERGAAGFLSKETDSDSLATHVRDVAAGKTVLDARSAAAVAARLRDPSPSDALSAREVEVLRLVAEGKSNPEIGKALFVAASTVKTHLDRAYAKLGVSDRAAAVARAKDLKVL
jgi:DNA-binding NarL/FixJ family response regulator